MMLALDPDRGRVSATPGALATCPLCGSEVRAKCGRIPVWHWAHVARASCDSFAEPMTAWHRDWQCCWAEPHREVVMGLHRADIYTPNGVVVEFQHSGISAAEIEEREEFYGPAMIWVFDAVDLYDAPGRREFKLAQAKYVNAVEKGMKSHPSNCRSHLHSWTVLPSIGEPYREPIPCGVELANSIKRCVEAGFEHLRPRCPDFRLGIDQRVQARKLDSALYYYWLWPRRSIQACKRTVFLDIGADKLLQLQPRPFKGSLQITPNGGWCHLWSRDAFLSELGAQTGDVA